MLKNQIIKSIYENYNDKYILRVRSDKTIVYYKGIKALEITGNEIKLSEATFKCNPTGIKDNDEMEYLKNLKDVNKNINGQMTGISFEIATVFNKKEIKDNLESFFEFCKSQKNYSDLLNENDIRKQLECTFDCLEGITDLEEVKKIEKENRIYLNFKKPIHTMDDIIDLQFQFYKHMLIKEKVIKREWIKSVTFEGFDIDGKDKSFEELQMIIENAITNYKGKDCLEKKYQHIFLLQASKSNVFAKDVIPFEEEYPITNETRGKSGRVDCIFYTYNQNEVTDIFLIEIKVDEKVILKDNGVLTHLDDVKSIVDSKKCNNYFKDIVKTINNSNKTLGIDSDKLELSPNYKIHFYTVFGFTNKNSRNIVEEKLNKLLDKKNINELCNRNELDRYFENKTIYDVGKCRNDCEIKFFFDSNFWNIEGDAISCDYEDVTNEFFKQ